MDISPVSQTAPYSAVQIANEFIVRGVADGIQDMTNMKIQKLVYFAQGFYLALHNRPLIQEDFVVWKHGPVVRELYEKFKDVIVQQGWGSKHNFTEPLREQDGRVLQVRSDDAEAICVINSVWASCKNHKASYLRLMTHRPNSPWTITFNKEGLNARIPSAETIRYFQNLMNAN